MISHVIGVVEGCIQMLGELKLMDVLLLKWFGNVEIVGALRGLLLEGDECLYHIGLEISRRRLSKYF